MASKVPPTRVYVTGISKDFFPSWNLHGKEQDAAMRIQSIIRHHLKKTDCRVFFLAEQRSSDHTSTLAFDVIAPGKATSKQLLDCCSGLMDAGVDLFGDQLQANEQGAATVCVRITCADLKPYDAFREI